ncbi:insulinase family protein [Spongiibacter taiwanensis]|uniref:insulinase family protein n=1 Tax=Spongiibacter taiwanensis TaxID=1748242 RepID=UPI00203547DE|nr:insulinase family protein [Spongiibacter taiwanensis]USA43584.1 insulinase family protein [Spongiibacter taiwanensis]
MSQLAATPPHPSFELISQDPIPALGVALAEYRHRKTGAVHYHIASDNPENVFLVALRTVPKDSTGVAHILEHTALCGSERFPLRDPFFMMIRRSLNTFMNAFTSSDWTAYPFASCNRKDFDNLLQVYLDAVFFSRLHPLDFAQEGHRLEFSEPGNPASPLVYKGVVFNEMKGAMSSVNSQLWHTLCKHLFPSNTYHYNSGGDPEAITDLSYEELQAFYRSHYHPSNATFMTFGDISAAEHQTRFEELALGRFDSLDVHIAVPDEKRYHAPIRIMEHYPVSAEDGVEGKTHIVMAWLLGTSTDLDTLLEAQLLAGVLLDNSASPLLHALETTELGSAPSPLCGLEDSMKEMVLACGIEGSEAEHQQALESLVLGVLDGIANHGVPTENVEAVLHQLELQQREISGDGYPYGLQLILNAMGSATHRGRPIELLDLDPAISKLRSNIQDPNYIKNLARQLRDNPHRVTLVMAPNTEMQQRREAAEAAKLAKLQTTLTDEQKQAIIDQAAALAERQTVKEDESILPKVSLDDVPLEIPEIPSTRETLGKLPCTVYARGTNGLVYQQVYLQLPDLDDAELDILSLYSQVLTELGLGEANYLQTQHRQAQVCGGISAFSSMRGDINDEQQTQAYLVLSSKALLRNAKAQAELMLDTLIRQRFDELDRIADIAAQISARKQSSITGNGHGLAMTAACAGMSPIALLNHRIGGLPGIKSAKQRSDGLKEAAQRQSLATQLAALHQKILASNKQLLLVADEEHLEELRNTLGPVWQGLDNQTCEPFRRPALREARQEFWIANSQVNFCAKAYPTVSSDHPDAPVLTVLATYLRNGYLHRCIREQGGAYGGGASQDSNIAAFRFYSYRDPRLKETLGDFDDAITWLLDNPISEEGLEQAILGIIGSIDKPGSPAGEAKQDFQNQLFGRTLAQRRQFRQRVLNTRAEDLQRVCKTYLSDGNASTAVVSNESKAKDLAQWLSEAGFTVERV